MLRALAFALTPGAASAVRPLRRAARRPQCAMSSSPPPPSTADRVLRHWFAGVPPGHAPPAPAAHKAWFVSSPAQDAAIAAEFGGDVEAALDGDRDGVRAAGVRGDLAFVVMLDQMARNVFRGSDRAFAGDAAAVRVALQYFDDDAARARARAELGVWERNMLYMPLMHSEELAVVAKSVAANEALLRECEAEVEKGNAEAQGSVEAFVKTVEFAEKHRKIVEQFGRYPHRNEVLGRESTKEELVYLEDADRFGQ